MTATDPAVSAMAAQYFTAHDPDADEQTLISLFLQSIKAANVAALSKIIMAPLDWLPFRVMHEQYFKEMEMISLLGKSTTWSMDPQVYADATAFNLNFMQKTHLMELMLPAAPVEPAIIERAFYEYLALSHALMSRIRFIPFFPPNKPLNSPFLNTLSEIEVNNGRLIQTQIRLLKELPTSLSMEEREEIIARNTQVVAEHFTDLLRRICQPKEKGKKS